MDLTNLQWTSNQLSSLDVSTNTALTYLWCRTNQLTSLDVSANTALTSLWCSDNKLTRLDVRNRNNANFTYFNATNNYNLRCIYVDDKTATYTDWQIDATATYVNNEEECTALAVDDLDETAGFSLFPNPVKEQFSILTDKQIKTVKLYSVSGELIKEFEKQDTYSVLGLPCGVYYINICCKETSFNQKLIIE